MSSKKSTKRSKPLARPKRPSASPHYDETVCHSDQAASVFDLIGGPRALLRALQTIGVRKEPSSLYRWMYSRARGGTGGCIPFPALRSVELALNKASILYPEGLLDYDPAPLAQTLTKEDLLK